MTQREAAEKMGVSDRWVRKLAEADEEARRCGGRAWAARTALESEACRAETQRQALAILKQPDWHDFGPTFASRTVGQAASDPGQQRDGARVDDRGRDCGRASRNGWRRCMFGDRGEAASANWCSGTPRITTGWKDEGRCAIWCG